MKTKRNEKRPIDKVATFDEVQFNLRSQAYYRLGEIQAAMRLLESMWEDTDVRLVEERKLLSRVFEAIALYDDEVRSRMRKEGMVK